MTERSDLLIDAAELDAELRREADAVPGGEGGPDSSGGLGGPGRPRLRVLDVRWTLVAPDGRAAYRAGHIPGAVYVDLETELSAHGPATAGRHPLPDGAALTAAARRWGLHPDDLVVAYDGGGNFASAQLWWLLRDAGFERVRLLDGALPAWIAAGLPLETGDTAPEPGTAQPGTVTLEPGRLPRLELGEVAEFARQHTLLDVRAPERYAGEAEPIDPRAGHVPGARNLPTGGNLDADGRFLPAAALRERFTAAGSAPGDAPRVGVYCGSGITASHTLFALALAGGADGAGAPGALFPGSWSQWSNHPDLPVATGPRPGAETVAD